MARKHDSGEWMMPLMMLLTMLPQMQGANATPGHKVTMFGGGGGANPGYSPRRPGIDEMDAMDRGQWGAGAWEDRGRAWQPPYYSHGEGPPQQNQPTMNYQSPAFYNWGR